MNIQEQTPSEIAKTLNQVAESITIAGLSGGHEFVYKKGSTRRANLSEITKIVQKTLEDTKTDVPTKISILKSYQVIADQFKAKGWLTKLWMMCFGPHFLKVETKTDLDEMKKEEGLFYQGKLREGKRTFIKGSAIESQEGVFDELGNLKEGWQQQKGINGAKGLKTHFFKDGTTEEGSFHENGVLKAGERILKDGSIERGTFGEDGALISGWHIQSEENGCKKGAFISEDGTKEEGSFYRKEGSSRDMFLREGARFYADSTIEEGTFDESGKLTDGTRDQGEFIHKLRNGAIESTISKIDRQIAEIPKIIKEVDKLSVVERTELLAKRLEKDYPAKGELVLQFQKDMKRTSVTFRRIDGEFQDSSPQPPINVGGPQRLAEGISLLNTLLTKHTEDKQWVIALQLAANQTILNSLFEPAIGLFNRQSIETGVWIENGEDYSLKATLPNQFPPIMLEIIRDKETQKITQLNVKLEGFIDIVKTKVSGKSETPTLIRPKAIYGDVSYSIILGKNNRPEIIGDPKAILRATGTRTLEDGTIYSGVLSENGELNGPGKITFPDGRILETLEGGKFEDSRLTGKGKLTDTTKNIVYEGPFENNLFNGAFEITYPNGAVYQENYKMDELVLEGEEPGEAQ